MGLADGFARLCVLAVIACAPKPPEALEPPSIQPPARKSQRSGVPAWNEFRTAMARPHLDLSHLVPDFHDELRWPLTGMNHPSLEPRFAVASVFAAPGIDFLELCKRGAQHRVDPRNRDATGYLRGWCAAITGDVDTACRELAPLMRSSVTGIANAVRFDLANILADHGGAEKAEHFLSRHRIHDPELLDTLAATYVELDMPGDAYQINRRAMDTDDYATARTQCQRLTRALVLGPDTEHIPLTIQLKALGTGTRVDETCAALHWAVTCWLAPGTACVKHLVATNQDIRYADFISLYNSWPRTSVSHDEWLRIANRARDLVLLPEAEHLVITAFDAALRARTRCDSHIKESIVYAIHVYTTFKSRIPPRLVELGAECKTATP